MKKILWCSIMLSSLWACQNQTTSSDSNQNSKIETLPQATPVVYEDTVTNAIYQSYQELKNALVADQFDRAKNQVGDFINTLKAKKGCETTVAAATQMENATDIEAIRAAFVSVNIELVPFLKHQKIKNGQLYEQYCPMANKGEGANWLSNSNAVRNPYYGAEMLDCGNIVDSVTVK